MSNHKGTKLVEISVPVNPDFSVIPQLVPTLSLEDVHYFLNAVNQNISKINPTQFIYSIEIATFNSDFRDEAFDLIEAYIGHHGLQQLNMILDLENYLAMVVLKKFEDQESYAEFYKIFQKFYQSKILVPRYKIDNDANGILFFVHNPVFLAHTNPLFSILESKKNNVRVSIASFRSDELFKNKCKSLGCEFIELQGETIVNKLEHLERCGSQHERVVWQCLPVFLSYFSMRSPNVNWWSFKFKPPIRGVQKYISSLPSSEDFKYIKGNKWHNFHPPFEMVNRNKFPASWEKRVGKIGAFCREELIDDEQYWTVLSYLLNCRKNLSFSYCGRKPIHDKWVDKFEINPNQISFLGWLANPQEEILKVALILDTYKLRHGLMGREASIAGIPIIYPMTKNGYGGFDFLYSQLPLKKTMPDPIEYSSFETNNGALALVDKLAFNVVDNNKVGLKQKSLRETLPEAEFENFINILQ